MGIAVVSTWQRRWRSSCHGVAPSSKTKSQTKTSALVAAWDHRIIRWAATANELDSSYVEVPVGTLLSGLSVFLQPSCKSTPQKWKSSHWTAGSFCIWVIKIDFCCFTASMIKEMALTLLCELCKEFFSTDFCSFSLSIYSEWCFTRPLKPLIEGEYDRDACLG